MTATHTLPLAGLIFALACALPANAADDARLTRMATCQDSWLEWHKAASPQFDDFAEYFRAGFTPQEQKPFFLPKHRTTIAGLRVVEAYPDSVGMGVGFSLTLETDFDTARKAMEAALGKKLTHCESGDGMHTCELEIAEQRSAMVMAEDGTKNRTLVGCYYYYEK